MGLRLVWDGKERLLRVDVSVSDGGWRDLETVLAGAPPPADRGVGPDRLAALSEAIQAAGQGEISTES